VTTQPDTDAPPTCQMRPTGQEWREPCGRPMPCPSHPYRHASPTDGCRCEHCVIAFSDAPQEGRPTTPQTEAYVRARQFYNERNLPQPYYDLLDEAVREAAAGALPSVERLADALPQVLNFEFFGHPVGHPKWQEIAQLIVAELEGSGPASFHESNRLHAAARLVAAPPEASER
jgi:hypothetical protein